LFCGAGGTSAGLYRAAKKLGVKVKLLAINHWPIAIETHSKNHEAANHICETLDSVDPRKVIPRGKLDLLVASPECTHHSIARGGKPMSDQSRASAWHVLRWAEALRIKNIIVENVKEFQTWGPLGTNGLPLKGKKGDTFRAFINALKALGYTVDYKILNAADYGDPTTRKRLFLLARLGNAAPLWPEPTHSKGGENGLEQWVAAREIIDWNLEGKSIAGRKKPLAEKTLRRIAAGLMKFGGEEFFAMMYGTGKARSIDRPTPTVTAGGFKIGLVQPFIVPQFSEANPKSTKDPLGTITTTSRGVGLVQPFVIGQQGGAAPRSTKNPLPTIATKGAISLIQPYLVEYYGKTTENQKKGKGKERVRSVDEPLPTVTAGGNRFGVVEPFFVAHNGERKGQKPRVHSVNDPMPTVTPRGFELVEPHLVCVNHGDDKKSGKPASRARSLKDPLPTVTTHNGWALIEPFLAEKMGKPKKNKGKKNGLQYVLDIRFRMLQPHELAAAMSFKEDYVFHGTKTEKVKQIGNAVAVGTASALCMAALA